MNLEKIKGIGFFLLIIFVSCERPINIKFKTEVFPHSNYWTLETDPGNFNSICSKDSNVYWICTDAGTVLFTQDGGKSWTKMSSRSNNIDKMTLGKSLWVILDGYHFLKSDDSGKNWQDFHVPDI